MLVILPTSTKWLLSQWQGPYPVIHRFGKVNYEVDIRDRGKWKRVFYVNMLKPFHAPEAVVCSVGEENELQHDDIPVWGGEPSRVPTFGVHLSDIQKQQLQHVISEYKRSCRQNQEQPILLNMLLS